MKEPPYPPDTKTGSFSFDLEIDRWMQSDSWYLTDPELRPWCLMAWAISWTQRPAGSLPSNKTLLSARLGCSESFLEENWDQIMRGWTAHSDGRLYHSVVTTKVQAILAKRADWRGRWSKKQGHSDRLTHDSNESPTGLHTDSSPSSSSSSSTSSSSSSSVSNRQKRPSGRFVPPTHIEVLDYCKEVGIKIDAQKFIDFYESKGWMVGRNKMKLWKAAVRNWSRNEQAQKEEETVRLPRMDDELSSWAQKHGYPNAPVGYTGSQYRQYLQREIEKRASK